MKAFSVSAIRHQRSDDHVPSALKTARVRRVGETRPMSKAKALKAFRRRVVAPLKAAGFEGPRGHFVRRWGAVTQIIELQHSIYGGRMTANLGLDLEWLRPEIRWIPRPALGPHAHDAIRWVRVGLVSPERSDHWWSFEDDPDSLETAGDGLAEAILDHGLPWLEAESEQESFLRHAEERRRRSTSPRHPEGCFAELRLVAAVHAWRGDRAAAEHYAALARALWPTEKARLQAARRSYRERHANGPQRLPRVPDLLGELERLIVPTRAGSAFVPPARSLRSK